MKLSLAQTLAAIIAGVFLFCATPAWAQETPAPPVIEATNAEALDAAIGKDVVVQGFVVDIGQGPKDGIRFLNFSKDLETGFIAATFPVAFQSVGPLEAYMDQCVEVRGRLEQYKEHTQIKILKIEQLTLLPAHAED